MAHPLKRPPPHIIDHCDDQERNRRKRVIWATPKVRTKERSIKPKQEPVKRISLPAKKIPADPRVVQGWRRNIKPPVIQEALILPLIPFVLLLALLSAACSAMPNHIKVTQEPADHIHRVEKSASVTGSHFGPRPEWTERTVLEDEKHFYFSAGSLNRSDLQAAIRCAASQALQVAVQGVSQIVTAEFKSYVKESYTGTSREFEGYAEESIHSLSENIHLQGVTQEEIFYEMVSGPSKTEPTYNVWVQLRISQSDYQKAKRDASHALLERLDRERRRESNERAEKKRLSRGAKVVGSVVSEDGKDVLVQLSEVNGVSVLFSSAHIVVRKDNRFAKTVSYFVIHVPENCEERISVPLEPVRVCGNAQEIRLPLSGSDKSLTDYMLGAQIERAVVLKGFDEIGRAVNVTIDY